jgi:hypothetical protein
VQVACPSSARASRPVARATWRACSAARALSSNRPSIIRCCASDASACARARLGSTGISSSAFSNAVEGRLRIARAPAVSAEPLVELADGTLQLPRGVVASFGRGGDARSARADRDRLLDVRRGPPERAGGERGGRRVLEHLGRVRRVARRWPDALTAQLERALEVQQRAVPGIHELRRATGREMRFASRRKVHRGLEVPRTLGRCLGQLVSERVVERLSLRCGHGPLDRFDHERVRHADPVGSGVLGGLRGETASDRLRDTGGRQSAARQREPQERQPRQRPARRREHLEHAGRLDRERGEPCLHHGLEALGSPEAAGARVRREQLRRQQRVAAGALEERGEEARRGSFADDRLGERSEVVAIERLERQHLRRGARFERADQWPAGVSPMELVGSYVTTRHSGSRREMRSNPSTNARVAGSAQWRSSRTSSTTPSRPSRSIAPITDSTTRLPRWSGRDERRLGGRDAETGPAAPP